MPTDSPVPDAAQSSLDAIADTLTQFRTDSIAWEREFEELIVELDSAVQAELPAGRPPPEHPALRQLEQLDKSLADQRSEFNGRQDKLADDMTRLHHLADQQVKLFAAWLNTATNVPRSQKSRKRTARSKSSNPDVAEILAQCDQLREMARES